MHIFYGEEFQKVAERPDGRMLFMHEGYFLDSAYNLTTINLTDESESKWREEGLIRQIYYSEDGMREFFNETASEGDFERVVSLIRPVIIQLWMEDKLA